MVVKQTPPPDAEVLQKLVDFSAENMKSKQITRGTRRTPGMSSPKHERDSDRESLTDWTLVDREGTPDKTISEDAGKDDNKDNEESSSPASTESKKKVDKEKNESGCGMEEEEGEELSEDLISMGKRVQEIKDEGDIESLASSDVVVLDQEGKVADEETDLSLASSPSLPDDLPAIKPDTQYRHTPDRDLNSRLNVVVALTLACVLGLGLGHFLGLVALSGDEASKGWSSRSLWQENLNSAQIIEALNLENEQLRSEITRLQQENVSPIKISGKDGKNARNLRERITHLLQDNEELRVAVMRQQFDGLPEEDAEAFNSALGTNFKLRLSVGKLTHLVPDLTALKISANDLQKENQDLQKEVGKLRYQEQPLPQELNAVAREMESLKKVVDEASKKKKVPPNYENAKIYLTYMSQVLQALHDFEEGGLVEKLDVATDVFEGLVPGNVKPSASVQEKLNALRAKFKQLKSSLASKWEKIKELSRPQHLTQVSQDTLNKMNRVVVNVVNKMKDIGQASIMKRGKASLESTAATLAQSLAALGNQFDKTWKNLEAEVAEDGKEDTEELLIESADGGVQTEEEKEETAVDDGDREAKEVNSKDARDEASEITTHTPNKSKKVDGKSGGSGGGGKGGGRGGGRDGGDDKTNPGEKERRKEKADKKKEDKPDGRRDRSRRSRMSDKEEKKEQKDKKAKGKEEKAKKNKDKENKKSKKDKEDSNKNRKSKDKDESSHKKRDELSRKNSQQDDKSYHKGQYNKYDKKRHHFDDNDDSDGVDASDESDYEGKLRKKYHKKKHNDDDDDDDKFKRKYQEKMTYRDDEDDDDVDDDDKKKGLLRHWEKPSRKNYRREYPGPKKAFIRRRGKNATVHLRDGDGDWVGRRATGREVRRKEEQKADWMFERAKHRSHKRDAEHKAEWQFDRARDRREKRIRGGVDEQGDWKTGSYERNSHKQEGRQAKRRYVRFGDDDDDDDDFDDDYEFHHHQYHHHHHHHHERGRGEHKQHNSNKGKREWVIPNFSATGKTFYH